MKVETEKLKKALNIVKPGLANKEIIEQTTSFAFVNNFIITYNDEICISHPLDLEISGAIEAEELFKFLNKVKAKEIDIEIVDTELRLKAGRSRVGFALQSEILLPIEEELSKKSAWQALPSDFIQACSFAAETTSTDMANPKLICVHITKDGYVEATDNYRMLRWELETELPIETTLVPAHSIKEMVRLAPTKISSSAGWLHFMNEDETIISCRVFDEKFVDLDEIMPEDDDGMVVTFPDGIKDVIESAEIFSQKQKKESHQETLELVFNGTRLVVSTKNLTSWFKETIKCPGNDHTFAFNITPYLLKDILKETYECMVFPHMLRFEGEAWTYVSSLQKFKEEEKEEDDLPF